MKRLPIFFSAAVAVLALSAGCDSDTAKARKQDLTYAQKTNIRTAKIQMEMLCYALMKYYLDIGSYPETLQALVKNTDNNENWSGPYLEEAPKDPWGHDYVYRKNDDGDNPFEIICLGPDGERGTSDDIKYPDYFDEGK